VRCWLAALAREDREVLQRVPQLEQQESESEPGFVR